MKSVIKNSIEFNGTLFFRRYRNGAPMAQSMEINREHTLVNALKAASLLAAREFDAGDKFEVSMKLTSKELKLLAEFLE